MSRHFSLPLTAAFAVIVATSPSADAGPFRDRIKSGLRDVAGVGVVLAKCVKAKLSGEKTFACPR